MQKQLSSHSFHEVHKQVFAAGCGHLPSTTFLRVSLYPWSCGSTFCGIRDEVSSCCWIKHACIHVKKKLCPPSVVTLYISEYNKKLPGPSDEPWISLLLPLGRKKPVEVLQASRLLRLLLTQPSS